MLKHVKTGWNYVATNWQAATLCAVALAAVACLFVYRLGSLPKAYSQPEIDARASSQTINTISTSPVNAPHKLFQFAALSVNRKGPAAMRAVSVGFAIVTIILFYYLAQSWYTRRIAIFGTILLATSSWFLHVARLGTPNILLCGLLALVACSYAVRHSEHRSRAWLLAVLVGGMSLYVPLLCWFIVIGALWQIRGLYRSFSLLSTYLMVGYGLIFTFIAVPLIMALIRTPDIWHQLTGIPTHMPEAMQVLKNIGSVPQMFAYHNAVGPVYWLGRMPILDLFTGVMFIFGVYAFAYKWRLQRTHMLAVILTASIVLVGISGQFEYVTLLVPFVYLVVAAGIALMLQQWFTVFPRNPIARSIGISLITLALFSSVSFQLVSYFVAWPNNLETRQSFSIKP